MTPMYRHRVRYHEVDQQGFLFNGRYFEIADVAHTEFIRQLGWTYPELNAVGVDPSVVHVEADFMAPARFDDVLEVRAECLRVGRSSFVIRTSIVLADAEVAEITITYANMDAAAGSSRPLPPLVVEALRNGIPAA